jgi:predicted PurR-regulated permease PerM
MARSEGPPPGLALLIPLATIIIVVGTLHYARDVLVPICLAILITLVLTPAVTALEKLRLKRVPAAIVVIVLFIGGVGAVAWIVARQLVNVAVQLPEYKANIQKKFQPRKGEPQGKLSALIESLQEIESDLSAPVNGIQPPAGTSADSSQTKKKRSPAAVVVESKPVPLLSTLVGPILAPVVTLGLVIVFSVFMLADREFLRNKLLRLAGRGHLTTTTRALDEAAQRVSRYLLFQSAVNVTYATIIAIGLRLLGIPNALVWGVIAGALRYVPYLGAIIGTALPSLLALGAFPDWHRALYVFIFFLVLELLTAYFIEPYVYGSQTGLSTLAILVAAIFWSLIWGPVGLLLSIPVTVCVVAFGRHIPHLEFLAVLFGDEPALPTDVKVYQRLLADDPDEAFSITKSYHEQNSLESLFDSVLAPVLAMAEQDRRRGALANNQQTTVLDNLRDLLEELDHQADGAGTSSDGQNDIKSANHRSHPEAMAVPVRSEADEIGALLLSRLVDRSSAQLDVLAASPLKDSVDEISKLAPELICISSVPPFSIRYARALYRTVKHLHPHARVIVGVWTFEGPTLTLQERIGVVEPDRITTRLSDAAREIQSLGSSRQPTNGA